MDPQQPNNNAQPEPQNKRNLLIIGAIVAVVVIVGVIIFAILSSSKDNNKSTNNSESTSTSNTKSPASDKYQTYNVTDKLTGVAFSASFYKDAKVEEKNGRTYLNSGETGSMFSLYLGVASGDKIDCGETPTTTMRLAGESTTICYTSDNTQYAGYAKTKNGAVKINLAGQKPISMDDAKAIMESVTFN